jgi:hypothetical protein
MSRLEMRVAIVIAAAALAAGCHVQRDVRPLRHEPAATRPAAHPPVKTRSHSVL